MTQPATSPWTPERCDLIARLWKEGKSAGEIVKTLVAAGGDFSRNSVIGRLHRMGLTDGSRPLRRVIGSHVGNRPKPVPKPSPVKVWKGNAIDAAPDVPLPVLREVKTTTPPRPWITRKWGECAFPVGEPERPADQLSCCAPTGGPTYCPAHRALSTGKHLWGLYAGGAKELERALAKAIA